MLVLCIIAFNIKDASIGFVARFSDGEINFFLVFLPVGHPKCTSFRQVLLINDFSQICDNFVNPWICSSMPLLTFHNRVFSCQARGKLNSNLEDNNLALFRLRGLGAFVVCYWLELKISFGQRARFLQFSVRHMSQSVRLFSSVKCAKC